MSDTLHDMARKFLLEIAVGSFERAVAAERAGADRLELCVDLEVAGLTPSLDLIRKVRAAVNIPVHVLVRPRAGNFVYSSSEFAELAQWCRDLLDSLAAGLPERDLQKLETAFSTSSRYEWQFWEMAWKTERWQV